MENTVTEYIARQIGVDPLANSLFGRRVITTGESEVTRYNISDIVKSAITVHEINALEIDYLFQYERGRQPILGREKKIRPSIKNNVVENNAHDIVRFKVGYVYGDPIQYVRRAEATIDDKDKANTDNISMMISHLNEWLFGEGKHACDKSIGENQFICGTAYRGVLPDKSVKFPEDEAPFEIDSLDPRKTFVVYSTDFGSKPLLGVRIMQYKGEKTYICYTQNKYFKLNKKFEIVEEENHVLGGIPIIEYPANRNRMGAFEPVLPLLNALNTIASNRVDDVEQFVQSLLKFINCDFEISETVNEKGETIENPLSEMLKLGAIMVNSVDGRNADVQIMTAELNQTQTQTLADHIYKSMLKISGMPYSESASGGDTGMAVILRDGWTEAEARAKDTETMFKESERQFLKIVLKIVRDKNDFDLRLRNIDIKFTRNRTDNLMTKTQSLQNLLEAGIAPHIAINTISLFSDPEQVVIDSEEYLAKWKHSDKPIPFQQTDATKEAKIENGTGNMDKNAGKNPHARLKPIPLPEY